MGGSDHAVSVAKGEREEATKWSQFFTTEVTKRTAKGLQSGSSLV